MTSSTVTVHWRPVDCIHHNGDITGYTVQYGGVGSGNLMTVDVSESIVTEANITNLTSSTAYFFQVAAVNSAGIGIYSDTWMVTTLDSECITFCKSSYNSSTSYSLCNSYS